MAQFAKSIKLFLMDKGDPNGRWFCELSNWTGIAYKIPRKMVSLCSDRPELNRCSVYFLFGYDIEADKPLIYIGETEEVLVRLKKHIEEKDYWNEAIVFISKDDHLNKAHIKYLENQFYNIALAANRYAVMNSNTPRRSNISEAEVAELEEFIYNAKIIINTLGHKVFESVANIAASEDENNSNEALFISIKTKGIEACGQATSDGFVVLKDSMMSKIEAKSLSAGLSKLRTKLIQTGKVVDYVFVEDVLFTSSSAAAQCIFGSSVSGPQMWKNKKGIPLKEIEEGSLY